MSTIRIIGEIIAALTVPFILYITWGIISSALRQLYRKVRSGEA